jgi:hypothetical protein
MCVRTTYSVRNYSDISLDVSVGCPYIECRQVTVATRNENPMLTLIGSVAAAVVLARLIRCLLNCD